MKVVILQCSKCHEPKIVKPGEMIPSFCFYCGGYLVYVEETELVNQEEPNGQINATHISG